ncbi:MAG: hypothetical protein ACLP0J_27635 [Solirubrobacteraceae bacterium]
MPEITGNTLLTGAGGGGFGTTTVAAEVTLADPPALLAVTVASSVLPTSLEATL